MLIINIFFVLSSITISILNGELSEEIKKNIKFVCGDAIIPGNRSGHLDGPGNSWTFFNTQDSLPRNFTLKKPIKKEDNLTIEYSVQCGREVFSFPVTPNICDIIDFQSDDEKTNLYKAFIDLLGFNVSSSCPIPAGTYTLKQQNDFNPWLSDLFGSKCSETDRFYSNYGLLEVDLMDGDYPIMTSGWHQIKLNDTDNCDTLGSVIAMTIYEAMINHIIKVGSAG